MAKNKKLIKIIHDKGIHTRVAAQITHKAGIIREKYDVVLYIKKEKSNHSVPMESMIALTSLSIKKHEVVEIICEKSKNSNKALDEMICFLDEYINIESTNYNNIDKLIDQNLITHDYLIDSIFNGVISVNKDNVITVFNRGAERITSIKRSQALGKNVDNVLKNSKLKEVLKTGKVLKNTKQIIDNTTIVTTRSPIIIDNEIVGAVAVFEDITEVESLSKTLESTREVKKKLDSILKNVSDGICLIDENKNVSYANSQFWKIFNNKSKEINSIDKIIKDEKLLKTLKTNKNIQNIVTNLDNDKKILSNISPIVINTKYKGNVWTVREITNLSKVLEDLNTAQRKIEQYQRFIISKTNEGIDKAFDKIIGRSRPMKKLLQISTKASKTSMTVLIQGESGTGKELVAKSIWKASDRKNNPFISINCGAIPENLIESELFGHEKGSFTSAEYKKIGKFELADSGTLFLDEIGDLSLNLQVKLLRVLQEKEFQRVGGNVKHKSNVRIIAATNKDLKKLVDKNEFRLDLYYRLNVIPIEVPALRDRKEDIPKLIKYFLNKTNKEEKNEKRISKEVINLLMNYKWPGNIRELENIVKRMHLLSDGKKIKVQDIPKFIINSPELEKNLESNSPIIISENKIYPLEFYEKVIIEKALNIHKSFNKTGKVLGISHKTVARKARKYGIVDKK
ncbi:MAG: sigma 54-interacting transcriptional regulator [Bacillota bacterium]